MQNQPLEDSVENLRRRLRFLPEAEREAEVAEFRGHLQERLNAYENAGETSEQALSSALQKWGEPHSLVRALRYRWLRRKLDHPVLIALFLWLAGQYLVYGLSLALYKGYRVLDPGEYFGIVRLFPVFPGSVQPPPHQSWFPYMPCLLAINCLAATGCALLLARLRLKSQTKGVALYSVLHLILAARFAFPLLLQGSWSFFQGLTLQRFLVDTGGSFYTMATSLGFLVLLVLGLSYYLLITLLILRPRKRTSLSLNGHPA